MSLPEVVSREEWLAARKELLAEEKAMTRARDALNARRRSCRWCRIEKEYVFDGPGRRRRRLLDLFDGRRQLIVRHFMFDPTLGRRLPELHGRRRRDLRRAARSTCTPATPRSSSSSRAPLEKIERLQGAARAGPSPGTRRYGSDFNYDFHVTLDESVAPVEYNYRTKAEHEAAGTAGYVEGEQPIEQPGPQLLPARRRRRLPHLLDVRARRRDPRRLVLLPRPDRARPPGGLGGAEGRAPTPHGAPSPTSRHS